MTAASSVSARIYRDQLPVIPGCLDFVNMGIIPEGAYVNRKFYAEWLTSEKNSDDALEMVLVDPQTSGGLLIAAPAEATQAILQAIRNTKYPFACTDIGQIERGTTGNIILQ